jgi:hypothetical protein
MLLNHCALFSGFRNYTDQTSGFLDYFSIFYVYFQYSATLSFTSSTGGNECGLSLLLGDPRVLVQKVCPKSSSSVYYLRVKGGLRL